MINVKFYYVITEPHMLSQNIYDGFKVSHFRCYDKKGIMKNGGNTVLSFVYEGNPMMVVSRCSASETYSRKKGIETCLRKYVRRIFNTEVIRISKDTDNYYTVEIETPNPKVKVIR